MSATIFGLQSSSKRLSFSRRLTFGMSVLRPPPPSPPPLREGGDGGGGRSSLIAHERQPPIRPPADAAVLRHRLRVALEADRRRAARYRHAPRPRQLDDAEGPH